MLSENQEPLLYFLHIPKTAGGTLIHALDNYFDQRDIFPPMVLSELLLHEAMPNHFERYRFVRGHFDYATTGLFTRPAKIITMLRNPIERTLSHFEHSRRDPNARYWAHSGELDNKTDLASFVTTPEAKAFMADIQTRSFVSEWYGISQLLFWDVRTPLASDDFLIELAKRRLKECVFVGIQERFWDSICLLCFTLSFRLPQELRERNVSENRLQSKDLSTELFAALSDINKLDNKLYEEGYALFATRFEEMKSFLRQKYPAQNTLEQQIEAHYWQQRSWHAIKDNKNDSFPLRYDFCQPFVGKNWYPREAYQDFYSRWTGPDTESTFEWEIEVGKDVWLEVGTLGALSLEILASFQVQVNNTLIPLERSVGTHGPIFRGKVPQSAFERQFQLFRFSSKTALPDESKPPSIFNRRLGVSVYYIELT